MAAEENRKKSRRNSHSRIASPPATMNVTTEEIVAVYDLYRSKLRWRKKALLDSLDTLAEASSEAGVVRYQLELLTEHQKTLDKYAEASSRYEKTVIVTEVVEAIRSSSPDGGFVKEENGQWYEVGDHLAREKVGQNFRDSLHNLYRSSTKAKRSRRKVVNAEVAGGVENLIFSNKKVSSRIQELSADMRQRGSSAPEVFVSQIFTQANSDILEAFKMDSDLLNRFNEAERELKVGLCA